MDASSAHLRPIPTAYDGFIFRSRLQAEMALLLDTVGLKWDYEPISFLLSNGIHYRPDFRLLNGRGWLEVRAYDSKCGRLQIAGFRQLIHDGKVRGEYAVVGPLKTRLFQRGEPDSLGGSLSRCPCGKWSLVGEWLPVCWHCGTDCRPTDLWDSPTPPASVTSPVDEAPILQHICCRTGREALAANVTWEEHRSALAEASVEAGEVAFGTRAALAEWVGTHRSQITRVAQGQELGGEEGWRLSGLASVVTALLTIFEPDAISGWLHGNNPHLGDRRPLDVLAEGDVAVVMAAVQAARTGAYA